MEIFHQKTLTIWEQSIKRMNDENDHLEGLKTTDPADSPVVNAKRNRKLAALRNSRGQAQSAYEGAHLGLNVGRLGTLAGAVVCAFNPGLWLALVFVIKSQIDESDH